MSRLLHLLCGVVILFTLYSVKADDPYRYFTWTVTYGTASPLGTPQKVIMINNKFPGPLLQCVTNDNLEINVINKLDEPFLLTWNGVKQRKNSWQDGVLGTNCPIPPNTNYTYHFQAKDQIGTYTYFPSTAMHRAAGGFGPFDIIQRSVIAVPYRFPDGAFNILIGDWYKADHKELRGILDSGKFLPPPDALLTNGEARPVFTGVAGKTYKFRVSNVGLTSSFNFRIQGHKMKVVEVEGSHVVQSDYDSIDVHVGQSVAALVTLNQPPKDYQIVASTRFTEKVLVANSVLHYDKSNAPVSGPPPEAPKGQFDWSMTQARTFRWNLTANAARPNPQGSFKYGTVEVKKKIMLSSSAPMINGKQRCAVNGVSYINPDTPLKLADALGIKGVFDLNTIKAVPGNGPPHLGTSVLPVDLHDFVEIVFQNTEDTMQSWHLDGYDFWVVGFGDGQWTEANRKTYNLHDALTRYTTQVYPKGWTAILASLDNQGMWNLRSAMWPRQYLGQQLYMRVSNVEQSLTNELAMPTNALRCGKATGSHP